MRFGFRFPKAADPIWFSASLGLTVLIWSCSDNRVRDITATGTMEATEVNVASKVGGQLQKRLVEEGDTVKQGDTLAIIDHSTLDLQLQQAVASADQADAQLRLLLNGARPEDIQQAEEGLNQAQANLKIAQDDFGRMQDLFSAKSVTQKQRDDAQARLTVTQAQYNSALQALKKMRQWARPEEIRSARAKLVQAKAFADVLKKTISDCYVVAPMSGTITHTPWEPGELVGQGATMATVSRLDKMNLMIYVTEIELGRMKLGQSAEVRIDAYPKRVYRGQVIYISPVAEFTPKNVQTKEDRVKLVFGIKIEVQNPDHSLKSGLPADATLKIPKASDS